MTGIAYAPRFDAKRSSLWGTGAYHDGIAEASYLELVKRAVTGMLGPPTRHDTLEGGTPARRVLAHAANTGARMLGARLSRPVTVDGAALAEGRAWTEGSLTMIGRARLDNIERCVKDVLYNDVPGDLIEAGVWRGGATIFMRAILATYGVQDRTVWVADSFAGFPPPSGDEPDLQRWDQLAVPLSTVRENFERFGLMDDQVRFVEGFFRDTLPPLTAQTWAVVRLDGDLYQSTMDGLANLYPGLAPGGWLLVDDYGSIPACARAVDDFRAAQGIAEPIESVDWCGICWQKKAHT